MTVPAVGSLLAVLADIPDPRGCQGRRHPSAAMLAATIGAILTGARGCEAIAQWVHAQETKVWHWLGFFRKPPCANTFRDLLKRVSPELLEEKLRSWLAGLLPQRQAHDPQPVALDGKSLCGTLAAHERSIHLLALFDHQTGGVLGQLAMPPTTNEHKAALMLLRDLVRKGQLITGDAIFCQRDLCQEVTAAEADYLLMVKENQPELKAAIQAEFEPGFSPL